MANYRATCGAFRIVPWGWFRDGSLGGDPAYCSNGCDLFCCCVAPHTTKGHIVTADPPKVSGSQVRHIKGQHIRMKMRREILTEFISVK